jgi:hypothetical protein
MGRSQNGVILSISGVRYPEQWCLGLRDLGVVVCCWVRIRVRCLL